MQDFPEGPRIIQYVSKQLSDGQKKWPTIEREAYAIIFAVNKLRPYLRGSKFTIYTDHKPLRSLFTSEMKNARIQRLAIMLQEYGCDVQYHAGKSNIPADFLSRIEHEAQVNVIDTEHLPPRLYRRTINQLPIYEQENDQTDGNLQPTSESDNNSSQSSTHDQVAINGNNDDIYAQIARLQQNDPILAQMIEVIKTQPPQPDNAYCVLNDTLYHIAAPIKYDNANRLQLVVPSQLQPDVLEQAHSGEFGGGHTGIDKTYDKLRKRYFWNNMYRDTVNFITNCLLCQARRLRQARIPMQDMPLPEHPFQIIGIDTCGPFPESAEGNKYAITVIDHFSGWPEVYAVPDKSAETVASVLLKHFIPTHTCPRTIISDNGTEFCNDVCKTLYDRLKMSHIRCSVRNPASNGKVERFHRFLNDTLAKYAHADHQTWDQFIPAVLMAYRTSSNESSKFTPYFIVYGRDPVLPMDTLLQPRPKYMGEDYVPCMLERLHYAYRDVQCHLMQSRNRNKERLNRRARNANFEPGNAVFYLDPTVRSGLSNKLSRNRNKERLNRRARNANFEPGDAVFYLDPTVRSGLSNKLSMRWNPYYRVVEQTGPVNFRIRHQTTGADLVVHAKFLRRCNPEEVWDNAHDVQESTSVSDSDSDADFHVVARNIPPDVLADSSSNGAPPSPPQYAPASDSPLPYVLDVPDDILCQSDNDMDTLSESASQ